MRGTSSQTTHFAGLPKEIFARGGKQSRDGEIVEEKGSSRGERASVTDAFGSILLPVLRRKSTSYLELRVNSPR